MKNMNEAETAPKRRYNTRFGGVPHPIIRFYRGEKDFSIHTYNKNSILNGLYDSKLYCNSQNLHISPDNNGPGKLSTSKKSTTSVTSNNNCTVCSTSSSYISPIYTNTSSFNSNDFTCAINPTIANSAITTFASISSTASVISTAIKAVDDDNDDDQTVSSLDANSMTLTNDSSVVNATTSISATSVSSHFPFASSNSIVHSSSTVVSPTIINLSSTSSSNYVNKLNSDNGFMNHTISKNEASDTNDVSSPPLATSNYSLMSTKCGWILSKQKLSWDNSHVASYNPKTKMFQCVLCQAVGFMSRIAEHYLGTHCNAKVFHCPQCNYCSAWWRCVRNHMSKHHSVHNAPASMWKSQPLLDEILQLLQNLKYSVDCQDRVEKVSENSDKRYICPKCPYATDRRDLYNRHENIHREEKPFQCYICFKLFNRADHVKKHFHRIHKENEYDIGRIRRLPSKRNRIPVISTSLNLYNGYNYKNDYNLHSSNISDPTFSDFVDTFSGSQMNFSKAISENNGKYQSDLTNNSAEELTSQVMDNFVSVSSKPSSTSTPLIRSILGSPSSSMIWKQKQRYVKCSYCPWKGLDSLFLRHHLTSHAEPITCVLCNYKALQQECIARHMLDAHGKIACSMCNFLADSEIILTIHKKEIHNSTSIDLFRCNLCPECFDSRPDLETHYNFIHNQSLLCCSEENCKFFTLELGVLESHVKEKHQRSLDSTVENFLLDRTDAQCHYCGCNFANGQSLSAHLEMFHENPSQLALHSQNSYCCTLCGWTATTQKLMIEHMSIHIGQTLRCQSSECYFHTPFESALVEHVLQTHNEDDGIVRCLHCGYACCSKYLFVCHYQEFHHCYACHLCQDVEQRHFSQSHSLSPLSTPLSSFLTKLDSLSYSQVTEASSNTNAFVPKRNANSPSTISAQVLRRSRKQPQPRKIVLSGGSCKEIERNTGNLASIKYSVKNDKMNNLITRYAKKTKLSQVSLLKCRYCYRQPLYFRYKKNLLVHLRWSHYKSYCCDICFKCFQHQYQALLHKRKDHIHQEDDS